MAAFNTFVVTLYQQHFYKWPLKKQFEQNNHYLRFMFCVLCLSFLLFFNVYFFLLNCLVVTRLWRTQIYCLLIFFFRSVEANAATKEPSYFASIYTPEPKTYKFHYGDSFEKATIKSPRDEQRQRSSPTNPATDRI